MKEGLNIAKKLLLVAGHGAGDPGAVGNGTQEAVETRRIVKALYAKLKGQIDVQLYDINKNLVRTNEQGNYSGWEVIEFHLNAGGGQGSEVLIKQGYSADALDNSLLSTLSRYFKNRGFKPRNDLKNMNVFATTGTSYRLVETCFIDSSTDMATYNKSFDKLMNDFANVILKSYGKSLSADTGNTGSTPNAPSASDTGGNRKLPIRKIGPGNAYIDRACTIYKDDSWTTPLLYAKAGDNITVLDTGTLGVKVKYNASIGYMSTDFVLPEFTTGMKAQLVETITVQIPKGTQVVLKDGGYRGNYVEGKFLIDTSKIQKL